jgi:parallel beta-helix repeat protein
MTIAERASDAHEALLPRRNFLRNSILLALPMAATAMPAAAKLMSAPLPASAMAAFVPPRRTRGSTEINVRNRGAYGDGVRDDTTAIQNAINALPAAGGTIFLPAGTYLVDPTRRLNLRSKMHLRLASGAVLKAKANAAERAYVVMVHKVSDVEISGGEIEGDRDRHLGTTGQWGHGIMVRGASRVTIRDILIRQCWGDGISIAATSDQIASVDVAISNIACINNRRQGMSLGQARGVKVYDSEFSYTSGITPGCGIDIESDFNNPNASDTHIENCVFRHNQGNGIQVYKRSVNTKILRCTITDNQGYGVLAMGTRNCLIRLNQINSNGLIGVGIRASSKGCNISQNHFYNNAKRFRSKDLPKLSPARERTGNVLDRHTEVAASQDINIWTNFYYDK